MNGTNTSFALLMVVALVGCGEHAGGTDAGTDASSGSDAGTHVDSGTGADSGTGTDASVPADVAACQASVDTVRAACVAEDPTNSRLCIYDALRPLCQTGRTAFVKALFDCLQMDACQSPSDPSGATDCVQAAIHAAATDHDHTLGMAVCACGSEPNCATNEPAYSLAYLLMLNDPDVVTLTSCASGASCPIPNSCMPSALAPALACP